MLSKFSGAVVANLSIYVTEQESRVSAHLIANNEAREKFVLSEAGLLMTARALDREERDTYMVTIVLGRKGILRGKQAIQVKVRSDTTHKPIDNACIPKIQSY